MMKVDSSCLAPLDPISRWALTVNWEPWIALGTIGAAVVALVVAGQGRRERIERDRARVSAILTLARGLRDIYRGSAEGDDASVRLRSPVELGTFLDLRTIFESVDVLELPTRATVDAHMTIAAFLQMTARLSQMFADGKASSEVFRDHCTRMMASLDECIAQLESETRTIGVAIWARPFTSVRTRLTSALTNFAHGLAPSRPSGGD